MACIFEFRWENIAYKLRMRVCLIGKKTLHRQVMKDEVAGIDLVRPMKSGFDVSNH